MRESLLRESLLEAFLFVLLLFQYLHEQYDPSADELSSELPPGTSHLQHNNAVLPSCLPDRIPLDGNASLRFRPDCNHFKLLNLFLEPYVPILYKEELSGIQRRPDTCHQRPKQLRIPH